MICPASPRAPSGLIYFTRKRSSAAENSPIRNKLVGRQLTGGDSDRSPPRCVGRSDAQSGSWLQSTGRKTPVVEGCQLLGTDIGGAGVNPCYRQLSGPHDRIPVPPATRTAAVGAALLGLRPASISGRGLLQGWSCVTRPSCLIPKASFVFVGLFVRVAVPTVQGYPDGVVANLAAR